MSNFDAPAAVLTMPTAAELAAKLLLGLEERLIPSSVADSLMKCFMDPEGVTTKNS